MGSPLRNIFSMDEVVTQTHSNIFKKEFDAAVKEAAKEAAQEAHVVRLKILDDEPSQSMHGDVQSSLEAMQLQLSRCTVAHAKIEENANDLRGLYERLDLERLKDLQELRGSVAELQIQVMQWRSSPHSQEVAKKKEKVLASQFFDRGIPLIASKSGVDEGGQDSESPVVATVDHAQAMRSENLPNSSFENRLAIYRSDSLALPTLDEELRQPAEHTQKLGLSVCNEFERIAHSVEEFRATLNSDMAEFKAMTMGTLNNEAEQRRAELSKMGTRISEILASHSIIDARMGCHEAGLKVIAELQSEVHDQQLALESNKTAVESNTRCIAVNTSLCSTIKGEIDNLHAKLGKIESCLPGMLTDMQSKLTEARSEMRADLLEQQGVLESKLLTLDSRVPEILSIGETKLTAARSEMRADFLEQQGMIESRLRKMDQANEAVERQLQSLTGRLNEEPARFDSRVPELLNTIESKLTTARSEIRSDFLEQQGVLTSKILMLDQAHDDVELRLEGLNARLSEGPSKSALLLMNDTVSELGTRLDNLQGQVAKYVHEEKVERRKVDDLLERRKVDDLRTFVDKYVHEEKVERRKVADKIESLENQFIRKEKESSSARSSSARNLMSDVANCLENVEQGITSTLHSVEGRIMTEMTENSTSSQMTVEIQENELQQYTYVTEMRPEVVERITTLEDRFFTLENNVAALEGKTEMNICNEMKNEILKILEGRFVPLENDVAALESSSKSEPVTVSERRSEHADEVDGKRSALEKKFLTLENKLDCAVPRVASCERRLSAVERDLSSIQIQSCDSASSSEAILPWESKFAVLERKLLDCCEEIPLQHGSRVLQTERRLQKVEQVFKKMLCILDSNLCNRQVSLKDAQATLQRGADHVGDVLKVSLDNECETREQPDNLSRSFEAALFEKLDWSMEADKLCDNIAALLLRKRSIAADQKDASGSHETADVAQRRSAPATQFQDEASRWVSDGSGPPKTSSTTRTNDEDEVSGSGVLVNTTATCPKEVWEELAHTQVNIGQLAETWKATWLSCCSRTSENNIHLIEALKAVCEQNLRLREQKVRNEEQIASGILPADSCYPRELPTDATLVAAQLSVVQENLHLQEQIALNSEVAQPTSVMAVLPSGAHHRIEWRSPSQERKRPGASWEGPAPPKPRFCAAPGQVLNSILNPCRSSPQIHSRGSSPPMVSRSVSRGREQRLEWARDLPPQSHQPQARVVDPRTSSPCRPKPLNPVARSCQPSHFYVSPPTHPGPPSRAPTRPGTPVLLPSMQDYKA